MRPKTYRYVSEKAGRQRMNNDQTSLTPFFRLNFAKESSEESGQMQSTSLFVRPIPGSSFGHVLRITKQLVYKPIKWKDSLFRHCTLSNQLSILSSLQTILWFSEAQNLRLSTEKSCDEIFSVSCKENSLVLFSQPLSFDFQIISFPNSPY